MMRLAEILCVVCFALMAVGAKAGTDHDAVVVEQTTQVVCKDKNHATVKNRVVYEILNERGKEFASMTLTCDKYDKLTSFSGRVANADGKELKKVKKGDLKRSEFSAEAFATDSYILYYDYTPPAYPVTVTYEWTREMTDNLIGFDPFVPQSGVRLLVTHAKYELTAPADMGIRHKVVNMPSAAVTERTNTDGTTTLTAEVSHLAPIPDEDYSLPAVELLPAVYFAPSDFNYLGTSGNCATWENFGKWQYGLLEGRDALGDELKARLHAMTDTCTTMRSKIALVYDLLAHTTRYVSIQLGIGGLQPFPASEVCRTGFGDCKGLANYMRAMLKEVGVSSVYCTINAHRRKNFYPDFASAGQSNHVVLCVPEAADSLWIECTDATLPLGYVHSGIADHNAMAVDECGGHLVRLPEYADTLNLQSTALDVTLAADGSASLTVRQRSDYGRYEDLLFLRSADERMRKEWLLKNISAPQAVVAEMAVQEHHSPFAVPQMAVTGQIESKKYANTSGTRLLVPLNPTHRGYKAVAKNVNRQGKVCVNVGFRDVDTVTLHLPEGFAIEALPAPVRIREAFGEFAMSAEATDARTVVVSASLTMREGVYSADTYASLYEFKKKVRQQYGQMLLVKRL